MATLTVQETAPTGITMTLAAAGASGDEFTNDGRTYLRVKNANAASLTVTIASQVACNQGNTHNQTVTVGASTGDMFIGPFRVDRYSDANGKVQVTYSVTASVTVAAVRL